MLFQSGENTVLLNLACKKLKGLGEFMRTLNTPKCEGHLDTKQVGSTCFPEFDGTFNASVNVFPL